MLNPSWPRPWRSRPSTIIPADSETSALRGHAGGKLDFLGVSLKILKEAAEMTPVPVLKGAFGTAASIVEILQTMRSNREECYSISNLVHQLCQPMVKFTQGKIDGDIQRQFSEYDLEALGAFQSNLDKVKSCLERIQLQDTAWILKRIFLSPSNKNALSRCRTDIDDAVVHFLKPYIEQSIDPSIEIVPRSRINLHSEPLAPSLFRGRWNHQGDASCVVVKQYVQDRRGQYGHDLKHWLDNWHSNLLQVIGTSPPNARDLFIVLQDPGVAMQSVLKDICESRWYQNREKATDDMLSMIGKVTEAAKCLAKKDSGGFRFKDADVYIQPEGSPVLANWDPARAYDDDVSQTKKAETAWDELVILLSKCLTGSASKPNYVRGEYGPTGAAVTRTVKHLGHFLWGFRYNVVMQRSDPVEHLFEVFSDAIHELRTDALDFQMDNNPILSALVRKHSAKLFGIWDVWESLRVEPGDIGYLVRGSDPLRPAFQKLFNVAKTAQNDPWCIKLENRHGPEPDAWSSEVISQGIIRHTLNLYACNKIGPISFYRGFDAANLNSEWDCTHAWNYLRDNVQSLIERAQAENTAHAVDASALVLIFSRSQALPYSFIRFPDVKSPTERDQLLSDAGFKNGLMYYFETPEVEEGHLQGYWSASAEPGNPIWPPVSDAEDTDWGWEYISPGTGISVEVSRKGPEQHIRYLHLYENQSLTLGSKYNRELS